MSKKRGLFVALEGIDGAGKSSVLSGLKFTEPTLFTRMPGGGEFAEKHRTACRSADIDDTTQVLFYSALLRDTLVGQIKSHVDNGIHVVCDRSWVSTLVYQAMPAGKEKLLLNIVDDDTMPVPDLLIYLDIPMSESIKRERGRSMNTPQVEIADDRYSKFGLLHKEKIKEGYDIFFNLPQETNHYEPLPDALRLNDSFAVMWKLRPLLGKKVVIIDATRPLEDVLKEVQDLINEHMGQK